MTADAYRLGVDFGTSSTVAALLGPDGVTRPLLFDSSPLLASGVFIGPDAQPLTGVDAERAGLGQPAGLEPNPKRRVDDGTVWLGEREVAVADLVAAVLRRVAGEAYRVAGGLPADVVLTYPAAWGQARLGVLAEAAARSGLERLRFVPEPVAAAAYFADVLGRRIPPGRVLVVYDLGAGTFDVSVVRPLGGGFEVVATAGLPDVGGLDLDATVVSHARAVTSGASEAWARLDWPQNPTDMQARYALWRGAKAAKEQLSRHMATDLHVPLAGFNAHLTREEFEKLATPHLEKTASLTLRVLRDAQVAPEQISGVFLVGGSSRIPLAATLLHRTLRIAPTALDHPELVVAEGSLHAVPALNTEVPTQRLAPTTSGNAPAPAAYPGSAPTSGSSAAGTPFVAGAAAPAGYPTNAPNAGTRGAAPAGKGGPPWKFLVAGIAAALVLVIGVGLVVLKPWGDGSASEKPITGARFAGALSAHTSYVNAVAVSPDGKVIATAGQDEKVYFWNAGDRTRSGSPLESFENSVEAIAFSPDGKRLASVAYGQVRLWDVKGRRADGSPLPGGTSDIDDVRFSADGETLWASGTDGTVLAWDVAQGRAKKSTKISFDASAQHTLLSPDGSKLLVESIGKLQFYNVKSGKPIGVPLKNESESSLSYYSMAFSPDGKTVAGGASNGSVVLWEVASRRPLGADLKPAPVNGSSSGSIVNALTFSADGKALASGGYDRSVQLWDIAGRKPLGGPLTGHTAGVTSLAFSPDDDLLVSASQDKTARVWNVTH